VRHFTQDAVEVTPVYRLSTSMAELGAPTLWVAVNIRKLGGEPTSSSMECKYKKGKTFFANMRKSPFNRKELDAVQDEKQRVRSTDEFR
jgi:hypothetical protein